MQFYKVSRSHRICLPALLAVISATVVLMIAIPVSAQTFTSGSTGADGPLDYSNLPAGSVVVFDPKKFNPPLNPAGDNIFNFTTINIPAGITVRLSGRVLTGPVFWLASGDVTINGTLDLNGENGPAVASILANRVRAMPGAGGFSGGVGGKFSNAADPSQPFAQPGDGPAGGAAGGTAPRSFCGNQRAGASGGNPSNLFLVPLMGGSGGGGGNNENTPVSAVQYGGGGGGGGGAVLIASSTTITLNGTLTANGGAGSNQGGFCGFGIGGPGAGGAIRLVSPIANGTGTLSALGGGLCPTCPPGNGGSGIIRLESFIDNFHGSFGNTPFTLASPFALFLPATPPPSITVSVINGTPVPQPAAGNLTTPDATINTLSPVQLTIQASFIPPGTVITLHVFSDNDTDQTVQTTPLLGTLQSSTATANVTFPSGFFLNFVKATWTTP
jgi:hypothetical protein